MLYQARTLQFLCVPDRNETSSIHALHFVLFPIYCWYSPPFYFVINNSDTAHNNADPTHMLITDVTYMLQYLVAQLCDKQKPPCVEVIKAALM